MDFDKLKDDSERKVLTFEGVDYHINTDDNLVINIKNGLQIGYYVDNKKGDNYIDFICNGEETHNQNKDIL